MAVLTVSLERLRFWVLWWWRRASLQRQWRDAMDRGDRHAWVWMEDRDREMGFGQPFLEAAAVIAPLLGLIGTVDGLSRLLSTIGPQSLLPEAQGLPGFGDVLSSTARGLSVSVLATATWHLNNGLRRWHRGLWTRDLRHEALS